MDKVIDLGRFFELAASNKIFVINLKLHEIKIDILQDYTGDFELYGLIIIEHIAHKNNIRYKKMDDFESYTNATDIDYDSEHVTFTGYIYKLNTPQFKIVKRSAYGKGANYMQEIVEYRGQDCFIPTSGMCFIKYINYLAKKNIQKIFQLSFELNKEDLR